VRKLAQWLAGRNARYIVSRLATLGRRYGLTPGRAKKRALACVALLSRFGCRPTFFAPGQLVAWNGGFFEELQGLGTEVAVHGYHHVDFRTLAANESRDEFANAVAAYQRIGLAVDGFRCPYLSFTPQLHDILPDGRFGYSSNKAIWWDVVPVACRDHTGQAIFEGLERFYQPRPATTHLAMPERAGSLVEIPVCLPDDLQLLDGLKLDARGIRDAWIGVLHQTHQRGELFDLMFHPESFDECGEALEAVLREARDLDPPVWITQLRDVNRWWREKEGFTIERTHDGATMQLVMHCSPRTTVLVRHLDVAEHTEPWFGPYRVLDGRTISRTYAGVMPFIGLTRDTPADVAAFLRDHGYMVETGPEAARCALCLTPADVEVLQTQVQLIDFIESSSAPLVRFWRWPSNARSALCITGDLDALSLVDYAARAFAL
jgi:hypothetical protein